MKAFILSEEKRGEFLERLRKYRLYAQIEAEGVILYEPATDPEKVVWGLRSATRPPKEALFPQTETLFKFWQSARRTEIVSGEEDGELVIFGLSPCEAKAFQILDCVFEGEYQDPYYLKKRERTTLVGLACNEPGGNCFCTSLDGGPSDKTGLDVLLTDLGDGYYVEVITEKGEKLVDESLDLLAPAEAADGERKERVAEEAERRIKRSIDLSGVPEELASVFEDGLWDRITMKCLGCGICTYLCPTCHCFDIQDEMMATQSRRARVWDSCMFEEYTLQASGVNPRPTRKARFRNRVYHKYKYFVDNFGVIACVGCGRCIDHCPVNMDIIDVLSEVKEVQ